MHWVRRVLAWGLPLVAAVCCESGAAWARPNLRVLLEYSADSALDCPSVSELSSSVAEQLGYDPFTSDPSVPRLRVAVAKLPDGAEAQIEWFDRGQQSEGERRLASRGNGCSELAESLPFALAVQIQLHASSSAPPAPPVTPPPAAPAPAHREPPPPQPAPQKARRAIWVGLGSLVRHGFAPGVSPGLRVFGVVSKSAWALELSGHATWPAELQLADASGFSARELGANLVPCARWSPLGLCALGTLSVLRVRGQGVDRVGSPSSITGGVGGRVQVLWPALERFGVVIQGEALVILGPRDVLLNQTTVWSTPPVALTAILDFAAIFK